MPDMNFRPFNPQERDGAAELALRRTEAMARLLKPSTEAHSSVTTANPGSGWAALPNIACDRVLLINSTGTDIEARRGGAGTAVPILDSNGLEFEALTNANQLEVRRVDQSNTQVTVPFVYTVL